MDNVCSTNRNRLSVRESAEYCKYYQLSDDAVAGTVVYEEGVAASEVLVAPPRGRVACLEIRSTST